MKKTDVEYDFVPQEVTLGNFNGGNAFVTCKYKYDKWQNVAVFERLCGYKPHTQLDPEKQLKKIIYNAVGSISNDPICGFTFVDYNNDLYNLYYHNCTDVVLQDPRGFNVAISQHNFWYMIDCAGNSMKNGEIDHKFAYAWSANANRFLLVDAETEEFRKCKEKSDTYKIKIDNNIYLTKSRLEVGKVYKGSDKFAGKYIYLGEMPIYGIRYHEDAIKNLDYKDLTEYCSNKHYSDATAAKRLVFYDLQNNDAPFAFKNSISKLIEKEIEEDLSKYMMFNDSTKTLSLEALKDFMSTCLYFNKIDMKTFQENAKKCSFELFEKMVFKNNNRDFDIYPYSKYNIHNCSFYVHRCSNSNGLYYNNAYVNISANTYNATSFSIADVRRNYSYSYSYYNHYSVQHLDETSIETLYNMLNPTLATAKFENGKAVSDIYMLLLQGSRAS